MKNKTAYWIVVIVLVAVVVSERFTISRVRRERDAVQVELQRSLFKFHNMYISQMDKLIHFLHEIQNDDYVDFKTVYNPDVSVMEKLSSFRSLTHRRNRLCENVIKETGDYILYARKEYAVRTSEQLYSRLLKQGDNGELVLKVDPVTKFDLMNIEKYRR